MYTGTPGALLRFFRHTRTAHGARTAR
ncbi:MAG: hypothetical protein H6R12_2146, partial [Proteobacteria bacterium]|nr:hypothetical protein [Pseudomonadota bacterium]